MVELSPAQVASLPKSTVISRLRFIPKTDSMRPITRVIRADAKTRVGFNEASLTLSLTSPQAVCCSVHIQDTSFPLQLYQSHVRDLLDVLRACVRSMPSLLGSTVWGMTDIHKVLRSYALAQKEKPQPLYFVKVGIT